MNLRQNILLLLLIAPCFIFAQKIPFQFSAKGLVVLSDADIAASGFIDGKLRTERGVNDVLTTIGWDKEVQDITVASVPLSNSASNWSKVLDLSKDGKTAFVVETQKTIDRSKEKVKNVLTDLPIGNMIYAVKINDLSKPKNAAGVSVGKMPTCLSMNPNGEMLAVGVTEKDNEIALVDFKKGSLGRVHSFPHKIVAEKDAQVTDINWHPSGKYLAITLESIAKVAFYEVSMINNVWRVIPFGEPVAVGKAPAAGRFTEDGRNFLLTDIKSREKNNDELSELCIINFDEGGKQHKLMNIVKTGLNAPSFALSPNEKLIAVSAMNTAHFPYENKDFAPNCTLMLFSFDAASGQIQKLDEQTWEGVLPKSLSFDDESKALVVTSYEALDLNPKRQGSLHFWEISLDNKLKRTGLKLTLGRGAHLVKVLRD